MKKIDIREQKLFSKRMDILRYFLPSFAILFAISLIVVILDNALGWTTFLFGSEQEARSTVMELFLVEMQITFIVVSLCTVLSTQSKKIYWVDSFQYRLVSPKYTNFTALSSYIIATLTVGLIWEIIERCFVGVNGDMGVVTSFVISIVLMIVLSMRMIGANFGEETIKGELENELKDKRSKEWSMITTVYGEEIKPGMRIPEVRKLTQVTMQEIDDKEMDLVCENLYLLFKTGFPDELKQCYEYAKKMREPETMRALNYHLMREAILDKDKGVDFFCSNCPIPVESVIGWWPSAIAERFGEAFRLWTKGKKEEAWDIRVRLYAALTQTLWDYWVSEVDYVEACERDNPEVDWEEADQDAVDQYKHSIILIMGTFVEYRHPHVFGEEEWPVPLEDEQWERSERERLKDGDVIESLNELKSRVDWTLNEWGGEPKPSCHNDVFEYNFACQLYKLAKYY